MMKIAILGSTGSIGTQTLDIVREQGDIQVTAIAAGSNIKKLEEQMREFHPLLVCVFQEDAAKELRDRTKDLKDVYKRQADRIGRGFRDYRGNDYQR